MASVALVNTWPHDPNSSNISMTLSSMDDLGEIKLNSRNAPVDAPPIKFRSHYERVKRNMKPLSHYFKAIEPPPENIEGKRMLARIRDLLPLKQDVTTAMPPESEMTVERTRESLNVTRIVRMALDGSLAVHRASRSLTGDRAALEIELHVTRYAAKCSSTAAKVPSSHRRPVVRLSSLWPRQRNLLQRRARASGCTSASG